MFEIDGGELSIETVQDDIRCAWKGPKGDSLHTKRHAYKAIQAVVRCLSGFSLAFVSNFHLPMPTVGVMGGKDGCFLKEIYALIYL